MNKKQLVGLNNKLSRQRKRPLNKKSTCISWRPYSIKNWSRRSNLWTKWL